MGEMYGKKVLFVEPSTNTLNLLTRFLRPYEHEKKSTLECLICAWFMPECILLLVGLIQWPTTNPSSSNAIVLLSTSKETSWRIFTPQWFIIPVIQLKFQIFLPLLTRVGRDSPQSRAASCRKSQKDKDRVVNTLKPKERVYHFNHKSDEASMFFF